jgi:hypothetical protein
VSYLKIVLIIKFFYEMTKLKLNKEVIAKLNDDSMNRVEGGLDYTGLCEKTLDFKCEAKRHLSNLGIDTCMEM